MHASFNAAGAMVVIPGGWQQIPALIILTIVVTAHRARRGLSITDGYAPGLVPATDPLPSNPRRSNPLPPNPPRRQCHDADRLDQRNR